MTRSVVLTNKTIKTTTIEPRKNNVLITLNFSDESMQSVILTRSECKELSEAFALASVPIFSRTQR